MLSSNKIPPPTNVMRLTGKLPQTRCIKLIKNERRRRIDYSRYTKCDKIITGYVRFLCYSKLHKSPVFVTQTEIKYFKLRINPMERTNRHTQRKKWKKCKFGIVFFSFLSVDQQPRNVITLWRMWEREQKETCVIFYIFNVISISINSHETLSFLAAFRSRIVLIGIF